jgi:hypothetical protein
MFESGHKGVVIIHVSFGAAIAAEKAGIGRSGYFTINTRFPDAYCQLTWTAFRLCVSCAPNSAAPFVCAGFAL